MADGVWKGVYPQVLGCSRQLSLSKFFDPSTPFMRKVPHIGTSDWCSIQQTGNDVSCHNKHHYFLLPPPQVFLRHLLFLLKDLSAIFGPPSGNFGFCRRCSVVGGEPVPPAPLGWYLDIYPKLCFFAVLCVCAFSSLEV